MKKAKRSLSFILALVMLFPLLAVAVTAAEEESNVIWAETFDGETNQLYSGPASMQVVAKSTLDPTDKAVKFDVKGVAAPERTAPYYAWNGHKAIYEITDYTYDSATNTVTGKFNNGTTYDISGTLDTGTAATCTAGTYYVYTPEMVDARSGSNNVAQPVIVYNPKVLASETPSVILQYKIWFENGTKGVFASRIMTTGKKYVELFGFKGNGNNTVTLQQHENATIVSGSAVSLKTEQWYTVSVVVDLADTLRRVYLDGVYAFSTVNKAGDSFDLSAGFDLNSSKWSLLQVNRNNTIPSALAGSVMIDDVCILDSMINSMPAVSATDDFESYTSDKITTADGYNTASSSIQATIVAYNKLLKETRDGKENQFVRVPLLYDGTGTNTISTAGYTNRDKTLQFGNSVMTKANGQYAVFDVDYRHNAETNCSDGSIEIQLRDFYFDMESSKEAAIKYNGTTVWEPVASTVYNKKGIFLSLFTINLKTGSVSCSASTKAMTTTGASGLIENAWNHVQYVLDLESTAYRIYINGILYGYGDALNMTYSENGYNAVKNASNISIPANQLIIAKVNQKDKTGNTCYNKVGEANETYSDVNYIDIDNVSFKSTNELPPIVLPPVKASDDFEGYTAGTKASAANSFNTSDVAYNTIFAETVSGAENKFVRLPLVYDGTGENTISTAGYTNRDKSLYLKHGTINSETGKYAVITVDYRPHAEADNGGTATVEIQLRSYTFDALVANGSQACPKGGAYAALTEDAKGVSGIFLNLFTINLASGEITMSTTGSVEKTGAPGMKKDEWNTVQYVLNLEDVSASLYVNGKLYSTSEGSVATGSDWTAYTNPTNISIGANKVILAKLNHKDSAGNPCYDLVGDANETYSNVNYIDLDNISIASATENDVLSVPTTSDRGETLLYVEVNGEKVPNKNLYLTEDLEYTVKYFDPSTIEAGGILSTVQKSSVRLKAPAGLRFATEVVDIEKFEEIFAQSGNDYKEVHFGHLIVPTTYLADTDFTVEALAAAGKKYLTVDGTYGHYYKLDNDDATMHFVGSIVNLLASNIDREFSATGYIRITLWSGIELYFYANGNHHTSVMSVAQTALKDENAKWTSLQKSILDAYAAGESLEKAMEKDMAGLNVLALGDSLFAGTDQGTPGCDRASQWVNLLGNNHNWTLTNLGIGGMTVSYTANNYTTNQHKSSMYDWLFNDINDFRWGTSYNTNSGYLYYPNTSYKYNYYYNCGDFTGKTADDVELILLEGGCNDYGTEISAPLGTLDSKDPGTFLGAWNCIVEELLEQYPNATIVFITTWYLNPQSRPNDTLTSIEYSTSINKLYDEKYASNDRIKIIDAGNPAVSGVDMKNLEWRNEYSNDAYHLNNKGMAFMAEKMLPYLWEIVMNTRDAK